MISLLRSIRRASIRFRSAGLAVRLDLGRCDSIRRVPPIPVLALPRGITGMNAISFQFSPPRLVRSILSMTISRRGKGEYLQLRLSSPKFESTCRVIQWRRIFLDDSLRVPRSLRDGLRASECTQTAQTRSISPRVRLDIIPSP